MKVSEFYNKILENLNIEYVFGVPGSYIMPIWENIGGKNKLLLARHENGAVFMADGYSRMTGKMGVALTTVGPGVTNSVTGIACAYQDSIPLLIIAGSGSTGDLKKGVFQNCSEFDRGFSPISLLAPITKKCFWPQNEKEAVENLLEAIYVVNEGRKGPVHISLPLDVQNAEIELDMEKVKPIELTKKRRDGINNKVIDIIKESERPIILCGWGTYLSGAAEELDRFCRDVNIPFVSTVKGVAACNGENELYYGIVGNVMHEEDRNVIKDYKADLVIALGSSLSTNSCPSYDSLFDNAYVMQVDIDESQFNRYRNTHYHIISDVRDFLLFLEENFTELIKAKLISKRVLPRITKEDNFLAKIIGKISELVDEETIIVPDAGNHWLDVLYWYKPKNSCGLMTNNGLASMGHAIGASIGMACANRKKVICITGDGSFLMSGGEINAAVNFEIDIIFVVINNFSLGRVHLAQLIGKWKVQGSCIEDISVSQCAKGMGANVYVCESTESFAEAFRKCQLQKGTSVIEVMQEQNDCPRLLKK